LELQVVAVRLVGCDQARQLLLLLDTRGHALACEVLLQHAQELLVQLQVLGRVVGRLGRSTWMWWYCWN
jgi:hypothetical protein